MTDWTYRGLPFDSSLIGKNVGFVYIITNLQTGKRYIGKKVFLFTKRVKGKRTKVESDWREYYGSNEGLLGDVERLRSGEL